MTSLEGAKSLAASAGLASFPGAGVLVSFGAGVLASLPGGGLGALALEAGSALVAGISSEGFPSPRMLLLDRAVFCFPGSSISAEGPSGYYTTFLGFFLGGGRSGDSSCF